MRSPGQYTFGTTGTGLGLTTGLPIADAFNLLVAGPKTNFVSILSALTETSLAQTLAEPTLVVRSGETPKLFPRPGYAGGAAE